MTKQISLQQLLDAAFQEAKKGGWKPEETELLAVDFNGMKVSITGVLFNQSFARGLFGTTMVTEKGKQLTNENKSKDHLWKPAWKYHLQGMVISVDPIQYLHEYVKERAPKDE